MKCLNKNLPEIATLIDAFGEVQASKLIDIWEQTSESVPTVSDLKGLEQVAELAIPLKGNETLYKRYNLLTNDGRIKAFDKPIDKWTNTLNTNHPQYNFKWRKTTDGKHRILIFNRNTFGVENIAQRNINLNVSNIINDAKTSDEVLYNIKWRGSELIARKYEHLINFIDKLKLPIHYVSEESFHENGGKSVKNAYMYYDRVDGGIWIKNTGHPDVETFVTSLIHEIVHGYTVSSLINPISDTQKEFNKVISQAYDLYTTYTDANLKEYGFTNKLEFVSEFIANEDFRNTLKKSKISLYNRILLWLDRLFRFYNGPVNTNLDYQYRKSMTTILNLLSEINKSADYATILREDNIKEGDIFLAIKNKETELSDMEIDEIRKKATKGKVTLERELWNIEGKQLNDYEEVLKKAIENLVFKLKSTKQKGNAGVSQQKAYDALIKEINNLSAQEALIRVLIDAKVSIESFQKQYELNKESETFSVKNLGMWRHYLQGYNWLDNFKTLVDEGLIDKVHMEKDIVKSIDHLIKVRNQIIASYTKHGVPILVDKLIRYSGYGEAKAKEEQELLYRSLPKETRALVTQQEFIDQYMRDNAETVYDTTKATLLAEFKNGSKDINFLIRWFDNTLDSPDMVVSAAASMYSEQLFKRDGENFAIKDKLLKSVKELEDFYGHRAWSNVDEMYDLFTEKEGKKNTGYRVDKFKSTLKKDYQAGIDAINANDKIKDSERASAIYKLKDSLAKRNDKDYYEARWKYINELLVDRVISQDEYNNLYENEKLFSHSGIRLARPNWELLSKGLISQSTDSIISAWEQEYDWIFREPIEKYKNPQWEALKTIAGTKSDDIKEWSDKDPRIKFFKLMVTLGKEADAKLPISKRLGTRLPGMLKTTGERLKAGEVKGVYDTFVERAKNIFTVEPDEEQGAKLIDSEGRTHKTIPIRFTGRFEPELMSYDLATLYLGYSQSVNSYQAKMEILPEIELISHLLGTRKIAETDSKGNPILRDLPGGAASRLKDARVFKSNTEQTKIADQFNDWISLVFYEEGKSKTKLEKVVDTISKYTAFRLLGFNIINGISNVATGEILQKIEAVVGQYYTAADLTYASAFYDRNIGGILNDIGTRGNTNIVNLLTEKFRMLNEDAFIKYRKGTKLQQLFIGSTMFMATHMGEHWMQSRLLLALLNTQKAYDKNGKPIMIKHWSHANKEIHASILDMYTAKDGELILDERVSLEKSQWTQADQSKFMLKAKEISRKMHGAYSEEELIAIQRFALGRMTYQFRKFMVPGIKRRWAGKYYNNQLREFQEGNYRTFGRFVKAFTKEVAQYSFSKLSDRGKEKYGDKELSSIGNNLYSTFTSKEWANIQRTGLEIGVVSSIIVLAGLVVPMLMEDDDDDEMWLANYSTVQYILYRLFSEMSFYINPAETFKLMQSPAASFSFYDDSMKALGQMFNPNEEFERGVFKGENKLKHRLSDMIPAYRVMDKITDVKQQTSIMKRGSLINFIFNDDEK